MGKYLAITLNFRKRKNEDVIVHKFVKNLPAGRKIPMIVKALLFYAKYADLTEDKKEYNINFTILKNLGKKRPDLIPNCITGDIVENTEDETETEQQAFEESKEKIALDTKENVFNDEDIKPQETVNEKQEPEEEKNPPVSISKQEKNNTINKANKKPRVYNIKQEDKKQNEIEDISISEKNADDMFSMLNDLDNFT